MFESLNKKISTLTAIVIIVLITLLAGGILVWQYWETPKTTTPPVEFPEVAKGQVVIATDKTKYGHGEIIKITIKNDLNKTIWYIKKFCPPSCCNLHKWENDQWINLGKNPISCSQITLPPQGIPSHFEPDELKAGESIEIQWNTEIGLFVKSGKYKLSFYYGLDKDNYTEKTIYSNEFTITVKVIEKNEKCIGSNEQCNGKPDGTECSYGFWCDYFGRVCGGQSCVGLGLGKCYKEECVYLEEYENLSKNPQTECSGSCRCMKEKECEPDGGVYIVPTGEGECSVNSDNKMCCCPGV